GGAEMRACTAFLHDGAMRFLAPEATTATLWIDPDRSLAPFVRPVTFTGLDVDLGPIEFGPGSTLRVVLRARPGDSAPRVCVSVPAVAGPTSLRSVNSTGESAVAVRGPAAGRFDVTVGANLDMATLYRGTIEADGVNDATIPIDLK